MNRPESTRLDQLDELGLALMQRYSTLSRVFFARARSGVSRAEAGVLRALSVQPRRITELAVGESISQPAVTKIVNSLAQRGWVERDSDPADGRVVLVRLTDAGSDALERLRAEFRAVLRDELAELRDPEIETLASALEILDRLIAHLGNDAQ
jgi:DNA-binding MarR family transcriptional regulator